MKKSTSFSAGFLGPLDDDGVFHVYDDDKARRLVKKELKRSPDLLEVYVGLDGDWNMNNDLLWKEGQFYEPKFYRESVWAKPSLLFIYADGRNKDGPDCYTDREKDEKET